MGSDLHLHEHIQSTRTLEDNEDCSSCSDTSFSTDSSSDSEQDSDSSDMELEIEEIEEIRDENRISSVLDDYADGGLVFDESDLEKWKEKERKLMERYNAGYYRCKIKHADVYHELLTLYQPYITEEKLRMLSHPYTTQKNESMNTSVASFAPKNKTYSKTESLDARVAIAAGIQILGYENFWAEIYDEFGLDMDDNLRQFFRKLQNKKDKKREVSESNEGKSRRSRRRHDKLKQELQRDMQDQKKGMQYESGVALRCAQTQSKSKLTHKNRNPTGTPKDKLRCKYWHPMFCQKVGHSTSTSSDCFMYRKSVEERDAATLRIMEDHIETELQNTKPKGNLHIDLHIQFFLRILVGQCEIF